MTDIARRALFLGFVVLVGMSWGLVAATYCGRPLVGVLSGLGATALVVVLFAVDPPDRSPVATPAKSWRDQLADQIRDADRIVARDADFGGDTDFELTTREVRGPLAGDEYRAFADSLDGTNDRPFEGAATETLLLVGISSRLRGVEVVGDGVRSTSIELVRRFLYRPGCVWNFVPPGGRGGALVVGSTLSREGLDGMHARIDFSCL